jgi:predicted signal transduction protein with EAL and GGDEF domain
MLGSADAALYAAKKDGRNTHRLIFTEKDHETVGEAVDA